jgi:hypothetical protein
MAAVAEATAVAAAITRDQALVDHPSVWTYMLNAQAAGPSVADPTPFTIRLARFRSPSLRRPET